MTRRSLLSLPGLAPRAQTALRKPRALREGDTVGVIMPSTHAPDPEQLALVRPTIEYFGLKLKPGRFLGKRTSSFAQSIDRVAEAARVLERADRGHAVIEARAATARCDEQQQDCESSGDSHPRGAL